MNAPPACGDAGIASVAICLKNPNTSRPVTIAATLSTKTYGRYHSIVAPRITGTHTPKSRSLIQPFCESGAVFEYDFVMSAHTIAQERPEHGVRAGARDRVELRVDHRLERRLIGDARERVHGRALERERRQHREVTAARDVARCRHR